MPYSTNNGGRKFWRVWQFTTNLSKALPTKNFYPSWFALQSANAIFHQNVFGQQFIKFSTIKVACWPAVNMDCNCTTIVSLFQECLYSINTLYEKGNSLHKWICTIQIFMRKYFIVQQHAQNIINSLPNSHMVIKSQNILILQWTGIYVHTKPPSGGCWN